MTRSGNPDFCLPKREVVLGIKSRDTGNRFLSWRDAVDDAPKSGEFLDSQRISIEFAFRKKTRKIDFSVTKQQKKKIENTSARPGVGSENNTSVVSDADDGRAHGMRGA